MWLWMYCMYMCISVCTCVCMHACVSVYEVYACMRICKHVCVLCIKCVWLYVIVCMEYMWLCMYGKYVCISVCMCVFMHAYVCTCMCMCVCRCTHVYVCSFAISWNPEFSLVLSNRYYWSEVGLCVHCNGLCYNSGKLLRARNQSRRTPWNSGSEAQPGLRLEASSLALFCQGVSLQDHLHVSLQSLYLILICILGTWRNTSFLALKLASWLVRKLLLLSKEGDGLHS